MNITSARLALSHINICTVMGRRPDADTFDILNKFINEVEHLLKHNSIKQTPALFKAKQ